MQPLVGLLTLLLLLSLAYPCIGDTGGEMVVVFKGNKTDVSLKDVIGQTTTRKLQALRTPVFVGGVVESKEFIALLSGAYFGDSSGPIFTDAIARISYGDYKTWSAAEVFTNVAQNGNNHLLAGGLTAVMKGNKIFVLANSFNPPKTMKDDDDPDKYLEPVMFVGTVVKGSVSGGVGVDIKWGKRTSIKDKITGTAPGAQRPYFIFEDGNGMVTKDGKLIFPIHLLNKTYTGAASFIYSTDDGATWKMGGKVKVNESKGSMVEWDNGKWLFTAQGHWEQPNVYESGDLGATWKNSLMFSKVWGHQPEHYGPGTQGTTVTAPVDGKDVFLFLLRLNKKDSRDIEALQLWLSDGQRMLCVGTISEDKRRVHEWNPILSRVGNNIYVTREVNSIEPKQTQSTKKEELERVVAVSSLSQLFESAKDTVRAWRELDAWIKSKGIPTNELVGYLGDKKDNTVWADRYNFVNATVNDATAVNGGFRFSGAAGSGAKWPVTSQGENQLYTFTEKQFTLAANVTIHDTNAKGQFSLLGASYDTKDGNARLGIGYTNENKWYAISNGKGSIMSADVFKREKEYHVALTFKNGVVFVYVDGTEITNGKLNTDATVKINHFFMGATESLPAAATGSSCTVKNVMLFSRALSQKEITALTKEGIVLEDIKETMKKIQRSVPDVPISVLTPKHKEAAVAAGQALSNGDAQKIDHLVRESGKDAVKKNIKRADGAAVSLLFLPSMCLMCAIIVFVGI